MLTDFSHAYEWAQSHLTIFKIIENELLYFILTKFNYEWYQSQKFNFDWYQLSKFFFYHFWQII